MKITLFNPSVLAALGQPASVTFTLTPKMLRAWNAIEFRHLSNGGGCSANEVWNQSQGLPGPEARRWLRSLHASRFGIMSGKLTWADVKAAVE